MKTLVLMIFVSWSLVMEAAPSNIYERKMLYELLEQRRKKFDSYANSIEQKSGIFGNKTKKDMQRSNEVLTEIVKTDNQIISVLNRAVDFKNFEKVELSYEANQDDEQVRNLLQATDTLASQVEMFKANTKHLKAELKFSRISNWFLGIACLVFAGLFIKERRRKTA